MIETQKLRLVTRSGFFILFVLAPIFDIFRLDLIQGHFILLGFDWTLNIRGVPVNEMISNLLLRAFLPLLALFITGFAISWYFGRLYCGWLCPHYSVVEIINQLMRRASGKLSLWQKSPLPSLQSDGVSIKPNKYWWPIAGFTILLFAVLWAVTLLTYLLPPDIIWPGLLSGTLSPNQSIFISVATILFIIEFTLARHLFCKYGCAVGIFQSLVWMANGKARVISFDASRAIACASCDKSCEHACPMRLKPRQQKRKMFTCTQCLNCVDACSRVQDKRDVTALLIWKSGT